jgi:hypothetical protein
MALTKGPIAGPIPAPLPRPLPLQRPRTNGPEPERVTVSALHRHDVITGVGRAVRQMPPQQRGPLGLQ